MSDEESIFSRDAKVERYPDSGLVKCITIAQKGLTKRELAAMFAMQGFCSLNQLSNHSAGNWHEAVAKHSILCADALIAQLEKSAELAKEKV